MQAGSTLKAGLGALPGLLEELEIALKSTLAHTDASSQPVEEPPAVPALACVSPASSCRSCFNTSTCRSPAAQRFGQIPETVLYLHFRPEAWSDAFSLDVASGLGAPLERVRVELEVLPAAIPLEAQNFSIPEGGSHTLAPPLLRVTRPYFPTLPGLSLQVLEPPRHGALQKEDGPQARTLSAFSWREVEEQLIRYVHDGSETLTDTFVLMVNASEINRQSHPVAFTVTILPVNYQPPVLTTNTGLQVRQADF
ncbi:Chondroitin sulfate proteoglycan 4 [Saguinus oedipus]|uniref:Chondroitin sulfate proteoglycan 4 n=1 Tax=Saguinus oedipus TaxID=9490 RepID=A0ABQ9V3H8_SAGOE|nr:Chondroitin sulfate proteoglycan 4 [Saguinus oedipus]